VGSTSAAGGESQTVVELVRRLVGSLGGRYSTELGIEVDRDDGEIERWFVAATLFGTRISAAIAERTFLVLDRAGIDRIGLTAGIPWDDLVALLDEGGYARYDFRTATRLQELAAVVDHEYGGGVAEIGRRSPDGTDLRRALDALPGWGPVTVGLFLRELRGVWPGATPPLDRRAAEAARHLHLTADGDPPTIAVIDRLAREAGLDVRDLESGLVRLTLAHHRTMGACPGGRRCRVLA
jgi:hypothetical protein